jgi:hypothetical protein
MGDWYKDKKRSTYLGTYDSDKDAREETEDAAKHGWIPQSTAAVRASRGMTAHIIKPLGHGKVKVTITFVRAASDPASAAAALKTYAELRDSGVISEKEFNEKRKQLMGM